MTMEEYVARIRECLDKNVSAEEAERLMKEYEKDLQDFLDKGWSPEGATTAMIMGY